MDTVKEIVWIVEEAELNLDPDDNYFFKSGEGEED